MQKIDCAMKTKVEGILFRSVGCGSSTPHKKNVIEMKLVQTKRLKRLNEMDLKKKARHSEVGIDSQGHCGGSFFSDVELRYFSIYGIFPM
jgi:hypothetical protein